MRDVLYGRPLKWLQQLRVIYFFLANIVPWCRPPPFENPGYATDGKCVHSRLIHISESAIEYALLVSNSMCHLDIRESPRILESRHSAMNIAFALDSPNSAILNDVNIDCGHQWLDDERHVLLSLHVYIAPVHDVSYLFTVHVHLHVTQVSALHSLWLPEFRLAAYLLLLPCLANEILQYIEF